MCCVLATDWRVRQTRSPVRAVSNFRSQRYRARCCPATVAAGVPPTGKELIHRSSSSAGYRTSDPTFRKRGPRLSSRHRRKHARLTRRRSATSSSVNRAPFKRLAPPSPSCVEMAVDLIAAGSFRLGPSSARGPEGARRFMKRDLLPSCLSVSDERPSSRPRGKAYIRFRGLLVWRTYTITRMSPMRKGAS